MNDGYDVLEGGHIFTDYSDHPYLHDGRVLPAPTGLTTAAGRYQLMVHWWMAYRAQLRLADFSPTSQDAVALQQMRERHVTEESIAANGVEWAISQCSNIWASFPGNNYKQAGGHTMDALVARWNDAAHG